MPTTTPNGVPYPLGTDRVMDGDDAIHNLAQWLDDALNTRCRLSLSANINVADSTGVILPWGVEDVDPMDLHSTVTNPSRITIKRAGRYRVMTSVSFSSSGAGGYRRIQLARNGIANIVGQTHVAPLAVSQFTNATIVQTVLAAVGDYFEIQVTQTSGATQTANQSISTFFEMEYAGGI